MLMEAAFFHAALFRSPTARSPSMCFMSIDLRWGISCAQASAVTVRMISVAMPFRSSISDPPPIWPPSMPFALLPGIDDGLECHLREFPRAVPVDLPLLVAAHQFTDEHFAEIGTLTLEHKLLRVRFRRFEEVELRIGDDPYALQRHQGTHDIREVRR